MWTFTSYPPALALKGGVYKDFMARHLNAWLYQSRLITDIRSLKNDTLCRYNIKSEFPVFSYACFPYIDSRKVELSFMKYKNTARVTEHIRGLFCLLFCRRCCANSMRYEQLKVRRLLSRIRELFIIYPRILLRRAVSYRVTQLLNWRHWETSSALRLSCHRL